MSVTICEIKTEISKKNNVKKIIELQIIIIKRKTNNNVKIAMLKIAAKNKKWLAKMNTKRSKKKKKNTFLQQNIFTRGFF